MISLPRLRELVVEYLGPGLCDATPERVRALLDRVQLETADRPPAGQRWVIDEAAASYDQILREFFWHALFRPPEEAVPGLWLAGFEACFGSLEAAQADAADEADTGA